MQSFLDGVQPSGSAMEMMATALPEIFAADALRETAESNRLTIFGAGSTDGVPVVQPAGGPCGVYRREKVSSRCSAGTISRRSLGGLYLSNERHSRHQGAAVGAEPSGPRHGFTSPRRAGAKVSCRATWTMSPRRCSMPTRTETRSKDSNESTIRAASKYDPAHFIEL